MHGHSLESDPDSVFNCLSVCVFLCYDDNDTKCSKLLKASLRGTSGLPRIIGMNGRGGGGNVDVVCQTV